MLIMGKYLIRLFPNIINFKSKLFFFFFYLLFYMIFKIGLLYVYNSIVVKAYE